MRRIEEIIGEVCEDPEVTEELIGLVRLAFKDKKDAAEKIKAMRGEVLGG